MGKLSGEGGGMTRGRGWRQFRLVRAVRAVAGSHGPRCLAQARRVGAVNGRCTVLGTYMRLTSMLSTIGARLQLVLAGPFAAQTGRRRALRRSPSLCTLPKNLLCGANQRLWRDASRHVACCLAQILHIRAVAGASAKGARPTASACQGSGTRLTCLSGEFRWRWWQTRPTAHLRFLPIYTDHWAGLRYNCLHRWHWPRAGEYCCHILQTHRRSN